jgi:hypothetical protein
MKSATMDILNDNRLGTFCTGFKARIFKLLRSAGIDSKKPIPPAYIAEPVFLNVYGVQEWIPRKQFRQPM